MGAGGIDRGARIVAMAPGELIGQTGITTMNGEETDTIPNLPQGYFLRSDAHGDWGVPGESYYMGFTFDLESDGSTVYGWAEIKRIDAQNGRLLGWAYDDSGGLIGAGEIPEPTGLSLLALGAAGVAPWRRRRGK